jgi:hypothetical protein
MSLSWFDRKCDNPACGKVYAVHYRDVQKLCLECRQRTPVAPAPLSAAVAETTAPSAPVGPLRLCPRHGPYDPSQQGKRRGCPECSRAKDRGRSKDNAWRDHARFKNCRKMHLRHSPICVWCERKPATDIHHVDPDPALRWTFSNFRSLCHRCHSAITRLGGGEVPSYPPPWLDNYTVVR